MNGGTTRLDLAPDATWTVNDVLRHHPEAVAVFNAMGVDACCGGANTLDAAAADAGVLLDDLVTALGGVASVAAARGEGR